MRKILFVTYLFIAVLLMAELVFRILDFKPKVFKYYDDFSLVDSLYEYNNYTTDEYGIYKFSPYISDSIPKYFNPEKFSRNKAYKTSIDNKQLVSAIDWEVDYLSDILSQYSDLNLQLRGNISSESAINFNNGFPAFIKSKQAKTIKSEFDSLVLNYAKFPFNKDGFRSIEFIKIDEHKKPKVLLIGDSFAYGQSAKPFYNSFSDILLSKGNIVYNAGISGTDLAQYYAITKKYIPLLKPDIVVVNFFMDNDIMSFDRIPEADKPHEYLTNAGFFYSAPYGEFLNLEDTYAFYQALSSIPDTDKNLLNWLFSKLAVTTQFWGLLYESELVSHPILEEFYTLRRSSSQKKFKYTTKYLEKIVKLCEKSETTLLIVLIPDKRQQREDIGNENYLINDSLAISIFKNYPYFYPSHFNNKDFPDNEDPHFNNTGSIKYANYLDSLISNAIETIISK